MSDRLHGDFNKLRGLISSLHQPLFQTVGKSLAEEARNLVLKGFESATNPYGDPWAPLARKRKNGTSKPLRKTGRLQNSFKGSFRGNALTVDTNVAYAPPHQYGAHFAARSQRRTLYFGELTKGGNKRKGGGFTRRGQRAYNSKSVHVTFGEHNLPQRMMVPRDGDVPTGWVLHFERDYFRTMNRIFSAVRD